MKEFLDNFHHAIRTSNTYGIVEIWKKCRDVIMARDHQGETWQHRAVRYNSHINVFLQLDRLGLPLYAADNNGNRVLHLAAAMGNYELFARLACYIHPFITDRYGGTPIFDAISCGHTDFVMKFNRDNAGAIDLMTIVDGNGYNMAHCAAMEGNFDIIEDLYNNYGFDIYSNTPDGQDILSLWPADKDKTPLVNLGKTIDEIVGDIKIDYSRPVNPIFYLEPKSWAEIVGGPSGRFKDVEIEKAFNAVSTGVSP
jgi:ankyrin repeat protein